MTHSLGPTALDAFTTNNNKKHFYYIVSVLLYSFEVDALVSCHLSQNLYPKKYTLDIVSYLLRMSKVTIHGFYPFL